MRSNAGNSHGHIEATSSSSSGFTGACSNSRTSLKTMACVVTLIIIVALAGRFGSSANQSVTSTSDKPIQVEDMSSFNKEVHPINCTFLGDVERTILHSKTEIAAFWNISNYPNFMSTMNIPTKSWKIQKAKYVKLLLEANANFIDRAEHRKETFNVTFVTGFSGSSVTAGHDNYFHEAFPQIFENALLPVFRALHIPFTVRNHALGNNPCYPYDACIATHLGDDLDLLTWEQSMNCGRYPTPVDTFARSAYHMPKKPSLLFLTSGGPVWTRQDCLARNITTSGVRGPLTASEQALLSHSTAENALVNPIFQQSTFLRDDENNLFMDRFAQLAPMAQNVFGLDEYKCLGPYNASFCEKTPGGGAAHHPGKLMHRLRGESLAFFQLEMLLEALTDLKTVKSCLGSTGTRTDSHKNGVRRVLQTQQKNASPSIHSFLSTTFNLTYALNPTSPMRASTADTGSPTAEHVYAFMHDYLHAVQSPPLPSLPTRYGLSEIAVPPTCHTNYQPRMSNALQDIIVRSNWRYELSFLDRVAVERSAAQGRGYIDKKYIFSSSGVNSSIALSVHSNGIDASAGTDSTPAEPAIVGNDKTGGSKSAILGTPIWLCEVQKGFARYPASHADLNLGATVYIQYHHARTAASAKSAVGSAVLAANTLLGASGVNGSFQHPDVTNMVRLELSQVKNECYRTEPVPPGNHLLTLVQHSDKIINLAYVIAW